MSRELRGIRLNNPGNIERGEPWQGLALPHEMTPEQKAERRFCVFRSPEWGIRAIAKILLTYQRKHKLYTVAGIVHRWAPPSENDTDSYARAVASSLNRSPYDQVDVTDRDTMRALIKAIIHHENGKQPYGDEVIEAGIAMADLPEPRLKPLHTSKEVAGAITGAIATTGGILVEFQDKLGLVAVWAEKYLPIAILALFGFFLANRLWARWKGER